MQLFTAIFSYLNMVIFLAFFNFAFHMDYSTYVCLNSVEYTEQGTMANSRLQICTFLLFLYSIAKNSNIGEIHFHFKAFSGRNSFAGYPISLKKKIHILSIYLSNLNLL